MQSIARVLRKASGRCAVRGWGEAARQARAAFGTGGGSGARGAAWRGPGRALLCSGVAAVGSACAVLASPARAESSDDLEDEPSIVDRAVGMLGLSAWFTWTREPADRGGCPPGKLLPDPTDLPPGVIQRTLVLSLEDTLVHTEWERKFGHRTRKRPGLDAFLAHMSQFYEIVIFTSAQSSYGQPITEEMRNTPTVCLPSLPARGSAHRYVGLPASTVLIAIIAHVLKLLMVQGGYFQHALFHEHTAGNKVKDLSYLNRDLRHVIIVDTNPSSYSRQKYNGVAIKPWDGDLNDTELLSLVPFLEAVFKEDIQDVREVCQFAEQCCDALLMFRHFYPCIHPSIYSFQ